MPKSKRNKQVDLSKTKKHGLEGKKKLYEEVRSCAETYTHIFIFSVNDMRNSKIKSVREQWKHSRFFIGKNKVMAKALGLSPEDEFRMNLHKVGLRLKGERGLFFSNQSIEEVLKWFSSYSEGDFARSGNRATETVTLQEGPLSQFPHNLEPYLRQLGLPTALNKGIIHLVKDHTVCNVGDVLTPETAKIVKLLGYEMAEFYIKIECVWSQDGSFSDLTSGEESKENLNHTNSSPASKQTPSSVASMDVDEEEIAEPSDEMIENIIMKNRQSLKNNKLKEVENEASSNESSDDEIMTDFAELKTSNKIAAFKESNEPSADKVQSKVSEMKDIPETLERKITDTSNAEIISTTSPDKAKNGELDDKNGEVSESVEDTKITACKGEDEKMSELVEDAKITTDNAESNDNVDKEISGAEVVTDNVESESSEDEDIPELVADTSANNNTSEPGEEKVAADEVDELINTPQNMDENNESIPTKANESSLKRLSLDKSALHSPVMLEKRPKYSPKMTRSAMKAKKTVSKTDANKIDNNDQPQSSNNEIEEEKQPARGRSHKRHSTGESPAERKLRNRSVKIVKKKK